MKERRRFTFLRIPLCAGVICVFSLIRIPFLIPFTLTTLGVFFSLFFLGGRGGTLACLIYLALGCFGLPVFAGGNGIATLTGPTGGYLIGMLLLSLTFWLISSGHTGEKSRLFAALAGLLVCYLSGALWYSVYASTGFLYAFWVGCVPFVLPDLIKLFLARTLARRLLPHLS